MSAPKPESTQEIHEEIAQEPDPNIYTFNIHIGEINGLRPVYPVSEVKLNVTFDEEVLFETEPVQMSEKIEIHTDIALVLNMTDLEQVTKFICSPIHFALVELEAVLDREEITEVGQPGRVLWRSEESILDLEEALFGKKTNLDGDSPGKAAKKKSASKSKTKGSKSSQSSKGKKGKSKSKVDIKDAVQQKPTGPQVAGNASIDLVPFFLDATEIAESLILKAPAGQPLDDRVKSMANLPTIQIEITLDKTLPKGNIFYYTLESIFNLPRIMSKTMEYEIVLALPMNFKDRLVPFNRFLYAETPREPFTCKKYYGTDAVSKFQLCDDFEDLKSCLSIDIGDALTYDTPRLEYNIIKGEYASDDDLDALRMRVTKYRCVGLEIYMTNPSVMAKGRSTINTKTGSKKEDKKGSKAGSKKGSKAKEAASEHKEEEFLHLMAFVDICRLLCPGEKKTRVATELRTFNMQEYEDACGAHDSYFRPKPPPPTVEIKSEKKKPEKKSAGKSKSKSSKKSKSKSSKSSKSKKTSRGGKKAKGLGDLRTKLPATPPPPPSSRPVFDEQGQPTFIIVEFEFREPITPARDIEDLHEQLNEILQTVPSGPSEPKEVKSKYVTKENFEACVRILAQSIKVQYLEYAAKEGKNENLQEFLEFLAKRGQYQEYLTTLTQSAALYCNVAIKYDPQWSRDEFFGFIGDSYVELVEMVNSSLSKLSIVGDATTTPELEMGDQEMSLFYAKEATEIGACGLATRYYLQRIANNDSRVDYWLDYAIYKLQIAEPEAAQECIIEALTHDPAHRDSLVFFACLISRSGRCGEAETCLLNITLANPTWVEGWMALYCVYHRNKNLEGMELCLEISEKYAKEHQVPSKYEDLLWNSRGLPKKFTFVSTVYFINLRLFDEAEIVLANEIFRRQTDLTEYLLAVIDVYKGHYDHAFDHIEMSFQLGSCSYSKNALRGHIFSHLQKPQCAITEYEKITKSTAEIPFDSAIYLVYIRAGICYSALGQHQEARKVLLKASERRGTPYSWLATGVLYYYQHDYLSAEECLTISNTLDNIMPETWAYLTLVNIQLGRPNEASNCYHQAIDNRLQNEDLLRLIDDELKKWEAEFAAECDANKPSAKY